MLPPPKPTPLSHYPPPPSIFASTELSKDRNWSDSELSKLSSFMLCHSDKFQGERVRKEAKVFAILSRYIKTRNPNQCRNYVHKLLNKFKHYEQIMQFFRESLPLFEENYAQQLPELKRIVFPLKMISKESKQTLPERTEGQIKEEMALDHIEMKRTDVSYCDEQQNKSKNVEKHQQEPLPALNNENQSKNGNKDAQRSHSSVLDESFFSSHFRAASTQKQKKWQDCHEMYVQWTSKAVSLLEKYERSHPRHPLL